MMILQNKQEQTRNKPQSCSVTNNIMTLWHELTNPGYLCTDTNNINGKSCVQSQVMGTNKDYGKCGSRVNGYRKDGTSIGHPVKIQPDTVTPTSLIHRGSTLQIYRT